MDIETIVREHPLLLAGIKGNKDINKLNSLLPFSVGFEIECLQNEKFSSSNIDLIPHTIKENHSVDELRFRLVKGGNGFLALWNITQCLREFATPTDSGIHYHIGLYNHYNEFLRVATNPALKLYILEELDKWEYKGYFNSRDVVKSGHSWVRFNSQFNTMEFRIGEMSFDYYLIVERILHLVEIVKTCYAKLDLPLPAHKYMDFQPEIALNFVPLYNGVHFKKKQLENERVNLIEKIKSLNNQESEENKVDIKSLIKNRNII